MNDDAVSDEHPPSKTEPAFNRYVLEHPPGRPIRHLRQEEAGLRLVRPGPRMPWYNSVFLQSS